MGFQCVDCVNEGRRSTRQARAAYGGNRSDNPALTSFVLIGMNLAVWIAILATGARDSKLVYWLSLHADSFCARGDDVYINVPDARCTRAGGEVLTGTADGALWQLLTSAFAHVEVWHIAANMLSLFLLGPQIERVIGRARFLALYLISGLAGSVCVYWLSDPDGYTLGASGAIFGLLGALLVIVYKTKGDLQQLAGLLVLNAFITFVVPNVSWQGHLGGLVGGALVTAIIVYAPRGPKRGLVQWCLLFALTALLLMAVFIRSATLS